MTSWLKHWVKVTKPSPNVISGDNSMTLGGGIMHLRPALFLYTGYTLLVLKAGSKPDMQFRNGTGAPAADFGAGKNLNIKI